MRLVDAVLPVRRHELVAHQVKRQGFSGLRREGGEMLPLRVVHVHGAPGLFCFVGGWRSMVRIDGSRAGAKARLDVEDQQP